jgi:hypothetical protein
MMNTTTDDSGMLGVSAPSPSCAFPKPLGTTTQDAEIASETGMLFSMYSESIRRLTCLKVALQSWASSIRMKLTVELALRLKRRSVARVLSTEGNSEYGACGMRLQAMMKERPTRNRGHNQER